MSTDKEFFTLQIDDKTVETYESTFRIPPRKRIEDNFLAMNTTIFRFDNIKFQKGVLALTQHTMTVGIRLNQIDISINLPRSSCERKVFPRCGNLRLLSGTNVKSALGLTFTSNDYGNPILPWCARWKHIDNSWDDSVDEIQISVEIEMETAGRCAKATDVVSKSNPSSKLLESDSNCGYDEFFLSPIFSDVKLICGKESFQAHKFLLSCKSSVFGRMFGSNMKESNEGEVVIEDMEPHVLKEFLRYLYTGDVENLESFGLELFIAANKYDVGSLKELCENLLKSEINSSNALQMFSLGDTHDGQLLKEAALNFLKSHKTDTLKDYKTFTEFSQHYPKLLFELFNM